MTRDWRFIRTEPLDPYSNMAIDEAILAGYLKNSTPTFRIYSWKIPSLSFGSAQKPEDDLDLEECARRGVPFVRRITGGGAILHDDELTYSLVCSKEDITGGETILGSFRAICSFLINFYKKLELEPKFAIEDRAPGDKLGVPSAFCFAAKEKYDIVVGAKKLGGNAQKRTREAIFQHGSIPIRFDMEKSAPLFKKRPANNGITCLAELVSDKLDRKNLVELLKKSFEESLGVNLVESGLTPEEEEIFHRLKSEKYSSDEWNLDRRETESSLRATATASEAKQEAGAKQSLRDRDCFVALNLSIGSSQ